jgi:hypothetical protein
MSAIRAFTYGLLSFFVCGFAWLIFEPILSAFMPLFTTAGGTAGFVGGLLATVLDYYAILAVILVLAAMLMGAMQEEPAQGMV